QTRYPSFGNLVPRDIASRAAKAVCDAGRGVGETGLGVYLDFSEALKRLGPQKIAERYGNLFEMYERITGENPYEVPMRIFPETLQRQKRPSPTWRPSPRSFWTQTASPRLILTTASWAKSCGITAACRATQPG